MVVLLKPKLQEYKKSRSRMLRAKKMRILRKILLNISTMLGNKIKQIMFNKNFNLKFYSNTISLFQFVYDILNYWHLEVDDQFNISFQFKEKD
ncbi:hypothetical protein BpHYR1_012787 [Brachionus plicatilis]|uniref:Uncharacterized protein n=1 Tax=Brachionus plicatilis TaxID=10195 RepID=A0A3M7RM34_BRAPC|nr:hypothetical protein BpHYR1_012787 [Brachionus plicatilis]